MSRQGVNDPRWSSRTTPPDMRGGGEGYAPYASSPMGSTQPRMDYSHDHGSGQGHGIPEQSMGGFSGGYGPAQVPLPLPMVPLQHEEKNCRVALLARLGSRCSLDWGRGGERRRF